MRIDPSEPLPAAELARGRWAEPYRSACTELWTVHLRRPLTGGEERRGLLDTLTAADLDALGRLMAAQDQLAGFKALRRVCRAVPESVREVRLIIEAQLLQWGFGEAVVADALLVVSELVTNVVRATPGGPMTLWLWVCDGNLRIEVWDSSSKKPVARTPDLGAPDPGGWGLGIVGALALATGYRMEFGGKTVWAVLKG